jgi:hypothetical protein
VLDEHKIGGLNLYSTEADEIDPDVAHGAELFAAHAALALGFARRKEDLNTALASRKIIGQALGLVMAEFTVDEDQAFAYLRRVSSVTNVKLRDVAAKIVEQANNRANHFNGHAAGGADVQPNGQLASEHAVH